MRLPEHVNILLLGGGGREHAFAWKIRQSPRTSQLFIAPGNAGTAALGTNVDLKLTNFGSLKQFVSANNINLIVVGPEEPLVKGIYDFVYEDSNIHHVPVIGPSMAGARLEGSKDFAKSFMQRHGVPTARYRSFTRETAGEVRGFLDTLRPPYVLKADGLAAGKGVVITEEIGQAEKEIAEMMAGKFGAAGNTVIIEEYLRGVECSVFVATDGKNYKVLPVAKDYKRIGEGDTGPNTGGMGAVSPVPFADEAFMERVREEIIEPTLKGLADEGIVYRGFLFIGIMNVDGKPYVVEYNVRMGDPETQAVLPLISSDITGLFEGIAFGTLDKYELTISGGASAVVVCAAGGYPNAYGKGDEITGIDSAGRDSVIFHAGTTLEGGKVYTSGGRVLSVSSVGRDIAEALQKSYSVIDRINYKGKYFRSDIGKDLMQARK